MNTGSMAIALSAEYGEFCPSAISLTGSSWTMSMPARATHAAKRGNGVAPISLDMALAEGQYQNEPIDELTPEIAYERRWAATLLARAERRLSEEYAAAGKTDLYNRLKQFPLAEAGAHSFHDCAAQQGISEGSLKSAVHRLRQRYRELVRAEVAHTVGDSAEVEDEIRHLIDVVRR